MKSKALLIFGLLIGQLSAQSVHIIKQAQMEALFKPDSGLFVINTWATWCKPCMEELPLLLKADSMRKSDGIHFVFVSFDMAEDSARVAQTIAKKNMPGSHYLIDETDWNKLINAIDSSWSGTLPATWFVGPTYKKPVYFAFWDLKQILGEMEELKKSAIPKP